MPPLGRIALALGPTLAPGANHPALGQNILALGQRTLALGRSIHAFGRRIPALGPSAPRAGMEHSGVRTRLPRYETSCSRVAIEGPRVRRNARALGQSDRTSGQCPLFPRNAGLRASADHREAYFCGRRCQPDVRNSPVKPAGRRADVDERMLIKIPTDVQLRRGSNASRPTIPATIVGASRANGSRPSAGAAQLLAARLAMAASEAVATSKATEMIAFTPAIRVPTPRLAFPAPVELPMLPSLNDIDALRAKLLARAA